MTAARAFVSARRRRPGGPRAALAAAGMVWRRREGIAATEFALILPILMMIFFGMLEVSDAMMANRRVTNAANALVDLVGQERTVTNADLDEIFTGVTRMLQPTDTSGVTMRLASVAIDPGDDDKVIVEWSRDNGGGTPYAKGVQYHKLDDVTVIQADVSLLVAELRYEHKSGLTSYVFGSPIVIQQEAARWPRRSSKVKLCPNGASYC